MVDLYTEIRRAVPELRAAAQSLMTTRVVVRRLTGETTLDPDTYVEVPVLEKVYEGPAKLRNWNGYESNAEAAGATVISQRAETHFPVGALDAFPGDIVTVVESTHPLMVGRSARVVARLPLAEHVTADRVHVTENVGEEIPPWPS